MALSSLAHQWITRLSARIEDVGVERFYLDGTGRTFEYRSPLGDMDILAAACLGSRVVWYENDGSQEFTKHDLGYCAASHNYSNYLILITFVIFVLSIIMSSRSLDIVKKVQLLHKLTYGLIIATTLLTITLFISLKSLKVLDHIYYFYTKFFRNI